MIREFSTGELIRSPSLYPLALGEVGDTVDFIPVSEDDYSAASFLDARMVKPGTTGFRRPWPEICDAASSLSPRCHFLFHISHVGSTLLSRLLGHHPGIFSLREPAILRTLAVLHLGSDRSIRESESNDLDAKLGVFLGLWSRTFRPEQTALIKATSFVSEMAEHLMTRSAPSRAIFMFVSPLTFMKALLDGAMSDIAEQAEKRLVRLHRRLGQDHWRLDQLSDGERVVMSWLSEMFALHAAGRRFPSRVLWLDFDRFLWVPREGLIASLRHLGVGTDDDLIRAILESPALSRYAKAPAHAYDASTRQRLLDQSERKHLPEIRRGMAWLECAAGLPPVRELLESAAAVAARPFS